MEEQFEFAKLREKQHECIHPSWKCSVCGLYRDNIKNEQRIKIEFLEQKIAQYELIFNQLGYFITTETFEQYHAERCHEIDLQYPKI